VKVVQRRNMSPSLGSVREGLLEGAN